MSAAVDLIGDLLRDRPPLGAPVEERGRWLARKADVLDAIAAQAAHDPGLVDPVEARRVADEARVQVSAISDGSGS